ncbi:MAG: hypothetical protein Q8S84_07140 [bacterium]|nr:hypothetical protein [bacterium]MDP3381231.1 hypothetical protein [bacterium]
MSVLFCNILSNNPQENAKNPFFKNNIQNKNIAIQADISVN